MFLNRDKDHKEANVPEDVVEPQSYVFHLMYTFCALNLFIFEYDSYCFDLACKHVCVCVSPKNK